MTKSIASDLSRIHGAIPRWKLFLALKANWTLRQPRVQTQANNCRDERGVSVNKIESTQIYRVLARLPSNSSAHLSRKANTANSANKQSRTGPIGRRLKDRAKETNLTESKYKKEKKKRKKLTIQFENEDGTNRESKCKQKIMKISLENVVGKCMNVNIENKRKMSSWFENVDSTCVNLNIKNKRKITIQLRERRQNMCESKYNK